jgi:hypothetical protein
LPSAGGLRVRCSSWKHAFSERAQAAHQALHALCGLLPERSCPSPGKQPNNCQTRSLEHRGG